MESVIPNAKRLIIKIGSSLLTDGGRGLDHEAIAQWSAQIAQLRIQGKEIILVSSGAIAEGMQRLGFERRPANIHQLQACAAVGQMGLIQIYESSFRSFDILTAQILLTHADLSDRERYLNARATLVELLQMNVIPIINENDTVVTDEIKFGDNDTLSALVANLIEADVLIILTDQEGLFSDDPRKNPDAELIRHAQADDPELEKMAGGAGTHVGSGGMLTKVLAARRAARSGAHTVIAWGKVDNVLIRLAAGEPIGTQLKASSDHLQARKQWMMDHLQTAGKVFIDRGAAQKVLKDGKSLLPVGVTEVRGDFRRGEVIACMDESGREIARGLSNYSSSDAKRILGYKSTEIAGILGYDGAPELIHRANMVLL